MSLKMKNDFLQLKKVSKIFKETSKETLSDIDLSVKEGEFICIVGPSGCGKSTVLNLVAGLIKPSGGEIILDGEIVKEAGADRVVMFQEAALYPWLNVMENVMFGLEAAGKTKEQQKITAEKYLRMVQLWKYRNYPIHQISGGMKQRTALARALALDSKILLMDEPFSALDKQTINILRQELEEIWEKNRKTILYVTHSVEEAIYFADRVVVMSENPGKIKEIIPINLPRPRKIETEEFIDMRKCILRQVQREAYKSVQEEFTE